MFRFIQSVSTTNRYTHTAWAWATPVFREGEPMVMSSLPYYGPDFFAPVRMPDVQGKTGKELLPEFERVLREWTIAGRASPYYEMLRDHVALLARIAKEGSADVWRLTLNV